MDNFQNIKLASDLILAAAIMFMCFRLWRGAGGRAPNFEGRQLESSLKSLINEASEASRDFNQQLSKRQRELERVLFDIGSSESRINRAISSAEEKQSTLQLEAGKLEKQIQEIAAQACQRIESINRDYREPSPAALVEEQIVQAAEEQAPPYIEEAEDIILEEEIPAARSSAPIFSIRDVEPPALNIFGDPIGSAGVTQSSSDSYKPLAARVERQVQEQQKATKQTNSNLEMQKIYSAAEKLLREGQSLQSVSVRTALPENDLRVLAQIIERENVQSDQNAPVVEEEELPPNRPTRANDPRLGVLGGIKRQTQVL